VFRPETLLKKKEVIIKRIALIEELAEEADAY